MIVFKNKDPDQNEQINGLKRAYTNCLYGGSVFQPIKIFKNNKISHLHNRLYQQVLFGEFTGRHRNYGGSLKLLNVRMSTYHYCDIFISINSSKIAKHQWDELKKWHDFCQSPEFNPNEDPAKHHIEASKVEKYLTGVARIIYFRKFLTNENYYLTDVMEGELSNGSFEGYARCFEVRFKKCKNSSPDVSCKVGFWKTNENALMPHGKWVWYMTNQNNETTMRASDGIYTADKDPRNRIIITKCPGAPIEDFYKNVELLGSKKINLTLWIKL
jgi:hypothetical protein